MSDNKDYIPFNKPFIVGKELFNSAQAVIKNKALCGDGLFTKQCQTWLENSLGCKKSLLTHSCTAALEMAAILCDIKPGDEVILPSFTFVSTANAFALRGGVPVFIDIREDTLNIDEKLIERAITDKTKVIVPVHYAGVPCAMDKILEIASHHNLYVIEDAAQALLSKYKGRHLGSLGHLGTLSFHETKNIISGEGGALLINDESFKERAEIVWEKGTNRKDFLQGKVDKYTWVDIGSSYLPSELTAAFLAAQFEQADKIIKKRRQIFSTYYENLAPLEKQGRIRLPFIDKSDKANGHLFYIIVETSKKRTELMEYLETKNINSVFHYIPLHSSPAGVKFGRTAGEIKRTEDISYRLLRLPLYYELTLEQVNRVTDTIIQFYKQ